MKKEEFDAEVQKIGLEKVDKSLFNHESNISYYIDEKRTDVYGLYRNDKNKYVVFYKCIERSVFKNLGEYSSEEEAYDVLLEDLKKYSK